MTLQRALKILAHLEDILVRRYGPTTIVWPAEVMSHYLVFDFMDNMTPALPPVSASPLWFAAENQRTRRLWDGQMSPQHHRHLFWLDNMVGLGYDGPVVRRGLPLS